MKTSNPSSDIPRARSLLKTGLQTKDWRYVQAALKFMTRAKAVRKAPSKRQPITSRQKALARSLVHTDMTYHEIANKVGVANGGRISEIMTGKRK